MKRLLFQLVSIILTVRSINSQQCEYQGYTHRSRVFELIKKYQELMKTQSDAKIQELLNLSTDFNTFAETTPETDFKSQFRELVESTTSKLEALMKDGVIAYLDEFESISRQCTDLIFGAGLNVGSILNSVLSNFGKQCDEKVKKVSTGKLLESYDAINNCVSERTKIVEHGIDVVVQAFADLVAQFKTILEGIKQDMSTLTAEELGESFEKNENLLNDLATKADAEISTAVTKAKTGLAFIRDNGKDCLDGVVKKAGLSLGGLIKTVTSLTDGLLNLI